MAPLSSGSICRVIFNSGRDKSSIARLVSARLDGTFTTTTSIRLPPRYTITSTTTTKLTFLDESF
ncbi:hypothetical protein IG631_01093 [Alternaria alternata]|nr:hypothetical protein IG631_01093 [Alternaria alternata]